MQWVIPFVTTPCSPYSADDYAKYFKDKIARLNSVNSTSHDSQFAVSVSRQVLNSFKTVDVLSSRVEAVGRCDYTRP